WQSRHELVVGREQRLITDGLEAEFEGQMASASISSWASRRRTLRRRLAVTASSAAEPVILRPDGRVESRPCGRLIRPLGAMVPGLGTSCNLGPTCDADESWPRSGPRVEPVCRTRAPVAPAAGPGPHLTRSVASGAALSFDWTPAPPRE